MLKFSRVGFVNVSMAIAALAFSASASAIPFQLDDVFASTGSGDVNVYSQTGVLKQTLHTGFTGSFTTGSTFDSAGNFYVTAFSANWISKFDNNGALVNANWTAGIASPESIVFDSAGNAYIGNAGAQQIQKVDAGGTPITAYNTQQNTDWIDLAADQTTLLYSAETNTMRTLNTATNADAVFTTGPFLSLYAKRYLSDGGVLAASSSGNVYRFDASGALIQTYAIGIGSIFALNLDPDGTAFWTGSTGGTAVRKINIATGVVEQSWSTGVGQLFGLAVYGEIQAGGGGVVVGGGGNTVPEPGTLSLLSMGLVGTIIMRRRRKT